MKTIFLLSLGLALVPLARAQGDVGADKAASPATNIKAEEQRPAVVQLKEVLATAKTPEEKMRMVEALRAQRMSQVTARKGESAKETLSNRIARLKASAAGDAESVKRLEGIERQMTLVEDYKSSLQAAETAEGEQKAKLLEDVNRKRKALEDERQVQMEAVETKRAQRLKPTESAREATPEMAAIRARSDERRREIEQFKEALEKASPEERISLLNAWRARQKGLRESPAQISK